MSEDVFYIGVCTECHSDQPASYMEKTQFAQPPCKFCGGVVSIIRYTSEEDRNRYLERQDTQRGIYKPPEK